MLVKFSPQELADELVRQTLNELFDDYKHLISKCESPIEMLLMAGFIKHYMAAAVQVQAMLGKYRVDFLVTSKHARLVIECDGHEFHERSKEQVVRDHSKDRWLKLQGYSVFRFSGHEIVRDVDSCIEQIKRAVFNEEEDWFYTYHPEQKGWF